MRIRTIELFDFFSRKLMKKFTRERETQSICVCVQKRKEREMTRMSDSEREAPNVSEREKTDSLKESKRVFV